MEISISHIHYYYDFAKIREVKRKFIVYLHREKTLFLSYLYDDNKCLSLLM